jgi:drug/metabolite transporter (DMT)-like permease
MNWIILVAMTFIGSMGGLLFKQVSRFDRPKAKLGFFILGCGMYGIGALLNVYLLRMLPYSIVFPLTSLTYVWTMVLSKYILKEKINRFKIIGVTLILLGSFVIVQ